MDLKATLAEIVRQESGLTKLGAARKLAATVGISESDAAKAVDKFVEQDKKSGHLSVAA